MSPQDRKIIENALDRVKENFPELRQFRMLLCDSVSGTIDSLLEEIYKLKTEEVKLENTCESLKHGYIKSETEIKELTEYLYDNSCFTKTHETAIECAINTLNRYRAHYDLLSKRYNDVSEELKNVKNACKSKESDIAAKCSSCGKSTGKIYDGYLCAECRVRELEGQIDEINTKLEEADKLQNANSFAFNDIEMIGYIMRELHLSNKDSGNLTYSQVMAVIQAELDYKHLVRNKYNQG